MPHLVRMYHRLTQNSGRHARCPAMRPLVRVNLIVAIFSRFGVTVTGCLVISRAREEESAWLALTWVPWRRRSNCPLTRRFEHTDLCAPAPGSWLDWHPILTWLLRSRPSSPDGQAGSLSTRNHKPGHRGVAPSSRSRSAVPSARGGCLGRGAWTSSGGPGPGA